MLWFVVAAAAQVPRQISLGDPVQKGETQVIPLLIDDISEVVAVDLDLIFDNRVVTVSDVRGTALLEGFFLEFNVVGDTLKISAAGVRAGSGSGAFAEIVLSPAAVQPQFAFSLVSLNGDQLAVEYQPHAPDSPTAVEGSAPAPRYWDLAQNVPNPFNPETAIGYSLAENGQVTLMVYDMLGQRVRTLVDEVQPAGEYEVRWDGRGEAGVQMASGLYFCRLQADSFSGGRSMLLLK